MALATLFVTTILVRLWAERRTGGGGFWAFLAAVVSLFLLSLKLTAVLSTPALAGHPHAADAAALLAGVLAVVAVGLLLKAQPNDRGRD